MRADRGIHLALFLLSASVLVLEVALTRIFSVMLWNHYTFLVISTALLGFGAAGAVLSGARPDESEERIRAFLARSCLLFAFGTVVCVLAVTHVDLEPSLILLKHEHTARLAASYAIAAVPFFFAGLAICRLLSVCAAQINTVYFADLIGAGVGALGVPFLLAAIGAPATVLTACTLAAIAGAIFVGRAKMVPGLAIAAGFALAAGWVQVADPWEVRPSITKGLRMDPTPIGYSDWTLHARIDVTDERELPAYFGSGVAEEFFEKPVRYRTIWFDGSNPSRLIRHDQDPWLFDRLLTAGPYHVAPPEPRTLIIGAGGGIDVMAARHYRAREVVAIEINPAMVDLVHGEFRDYIGDAFGQPEVTLLASEGRHHLTLDETTYDVIRLTGVDTAATSATGVNALDDAYIYTKESIGTLHAHLAPDGVAGISRACGWETLRLTSVIAHGLEAAGVEKPGDRVAVLGNGRWCDALVRKRPYTPDEMDGLRAWAAESHLDVLYDPLRPRRTLLDRMLRGRPEARAALIATHERNVSPPTDDQPFFFEPLSMGMLLEKRGKGRLAGLGASGYLILLVTLAQAAVLSALFILLPLLRRGVRLRGGRSRLWVLPYFSLLGLGFIMAELVFMQKYLLVVGGPARAMSVTLFSILVFGGIGAFFSKRIDVTSRGAVVAAIAAVVVLLGLSLLGLRVGLPVLLGFGPEARIVIGILFLAPVSFALGLPFPLGIRVLEREALELVPWAWASNACWTVIGSVLCLLVSISWGFTAALLLAGACYVVAALCVALGPAVGRPPISG